MMNSAAYREARQSLEEKVPSAVYDLSDEDEHERCTCCQADDEEAYSFYRRESFGKKDAESRHWSGCESTTSKSCAVDKDAKDRRLPNKIRWADECNKELARQNPRKKYTKKPLHGSKLKPILKAN